MSGAFSCQECHMPQKSDGSHDHRFVGVDIDLSYPIGESPLHDAVQEMLESAVDLQFGYLSNTLADSIILGDSLQIPITVTSLTAHSLPSGTSFSREVWLEVKVISDGGNLLYESGVIESTETLDMSDADLLLFTTKILDEDNVEVSSITKTHNMINQSLPGFQDRYHSYHVALDDTVSDYVFIEVRMLFRAFKPQHLQEGHAELILDNPELIENIPVFEMASIQDTVYIKPH